MARLQPQENLRPHASEASTQLANGCPYIALGSHEIAHA
jgi:hypothetical protein